MFARRNFVYKRSHNGVNLNLAARGTPSVLVPNPSNSPSSSSSDPKTTDPLTSLTPVATTSKTTETQATSSSSSISSFSISTTLTSTLSLSLTSASSSASVFSSVARATSSTSSTPLAPSPATTSNPLPVTTQVVPGNSFTPTSTLAPATTSSASSSGGTNTDVIIGGVAGTLAGIAVLGFLLMWCMRRQRNRDIDDFDAQAFKRQSAILVDDPVEPSQSYNPRPPTMIERHNASPALAAQSGYGGQNFYGSFGEYGQQSAYPPSEMVQSSGSPPQQAYGAPPMGYAGYDDPRQQIARQPSNVGYAGYDSQQLARQPSNVGYAGYDSQQQLARQPSNAQYLTRQPSSAPGYAPPPVPPSSRDPNAHYIDLNRSSISPYQAVQYADISRQLGTTDPNDEVPHDSQELPDGPLPSPFDDPAEATPVPDATSHVHSDHAVTPAPQPHGNAPALHQRPATFYEEGDAYSGI